MMKPLLILVAVLLSTVATAKVPPESAGEIFKVTVQMPLHESSSTENSNAPDAPAVEAHVIEITPNLLHESDVMDNIENTTEMPEVVDETTVKPEEQEELQQLTTEPVVPTIVLSANSEANVNAIGPVNPPPFVPIADVQNIVPVPLEKDPVRRKMRAVMELSMKTNMETEKNVVNIDGSVGALKPENPCDMQCTKLDLNPVCATNGDCLFEFPNQCIMDTFICVHPDLGFKATNDYRCSMNWLKRCTEKDLMG